MHKLSQQHSAPWQYDLTELEGLDVLSTPTGPIAEAQQLAAATWGADATWFLINGSTAGIHAAVLATCSAGDALILGRNAHISAYNAVVLAGCRPVYVQPRQNTVFQTADEVTPDALQQTFDMAQQQGITVKAAFIVSPTYFGVCSDIAGGGFLAAQVAVHPLIHSYEPRS
jgi:arginine decarboxylase